MKYPKLLTSVQRDIFTFLRKQSGPRWEFQSHSFSYCVEPQIKLCEVRIEVTECSYPSRAGRVPAEPAPSSPCHGSAHPSTPAGSATQSHSYQSSSADRGSHQFVPRSSHLAPISQWGPIDLWVCNTLPPFLAPLPPNFCRARVFSQFKSR